LNKRIIAFFINFLTIFPVVVGLYYFLNNEIRYYVQNLFNFKDLFWIIYFIGISIQILLNGNSFGEKMMKIKSVQTGTYKINKKRNIFKNLLFCSIGELACSNFIYIFIFLPIIYGPTFFEPFKKKKLSTIDSITKTVVVSDVIDNLNMLNEYNIF